MKVDYELTLGKIPPQANDIEDSIIGAILCNSHAFDIVRSILTPETFYQPIHEILYRAFEVLNKKQINIDLVTVAEYLRTTGDLEKVGGAITLVDLSNKVASAANIEYHARILFEKFAAREIIRVCQHYTGLAYNNTDDIFNMADSLQIEIGRITGKVRGGEVKHISKVAMKAIEDISARRESPKELLGYSTGISKLDKITLGLCEQQLTIIGARPGEGKSTLGLQIAETVAQGYNVAVFSLEMSDEQIVWKTMSSELNISTSHIRMGKMSDLDYNYLIKNYFDKATKSKMYIYDKPGISVFELCSVCRIMQATTGLKMVVIDYLQLLTAQQENQKWGVNREQEISTISRTLKGLSKELNIPVIAMAQLSRPQKGEAKRLPKPSDLRESGAIEQDADNIWFIYRPSYHGVTELDISGETLVFDKDDALIVISKCRLGETGYLQLKFQGQNSKFVSDENTYNNDLISTRISDDDETPF